MSIFTYHLVKTSVYKALNTLYFSPKLDKVEGLVQAEFLTNMTLGSSVFSSKRLNMTDVGVFIKWENDEALEKFLSQTELGTLLLKGWYVRLKFIRRWGLVDGFEEKPDDRVYQNKESPIVAVTLARMKLCEVPRFIRWGKPVEKLVRDHPGLIMASAGIRFPRTVSTFSIWKTLKDMEDMVQGRGNIVEPKRHATAMIERERKDFHKQFTTLRFIPYAEYGQWEGKSNIIPFCS